MVCFLNGLQRYEYGEFSILKHLSVKTLCNDQIDNIFGLGVIR